MASISSCQTRSIAGTSRSRYSSATRAMTSASTCERPRRAGRRVERQRPCAASARIVTACMRWTMLPLVSGSSRCSGSGCSAARSRWMAPSRNWYGHAAKRCSAETEYGAPSAAARPAPRACGRSRAPARRTASTSSPPRAQRSVTVRRSASLSRSRYCARPLHRRRVGGVEQLAQHREVVFLDVDGLVGIARRRPRQRRRRPPAAAARASSS